MKTLVKLFLESLGFFYLCRRSISVIHFILFIFYLLYMSKQFLKKIVECMPIL